MIDFMVPSAHLCHADVSCQLPPDGVKLLVVYLLYESRHRRSWSIGWRTRSPMQGGVAWVQSEQAELVEAAAHGLYGCAKAAAMAIPESSDLLRLQRTDTRVNPGANRRR